MTRIGPDRLSVILRTLAISKTDSIAGAAGASNRVAPESHDAGRHNPEVLRGNLEKRLKQLKGDSNNFDADGPIVTVKEILIWEFGQEILNHPEFARVVSSIVGVISANASTRQQVKELINELVNL